MIKVLIVDDSAIVRSMLSRVMEEDSRFEIVGFADNGEKAVQQNREFSPQLIIMDINMPIMNGIDATKLILKESSPAIVAFTTEDSAEIAYRSLNAGVLEVVRKPDFVTMTKKTLQNFCDRFISIATSHKKKIMNLPKEISEATPIEELLQPVNSFNLFKVLLIGASTGGPVAIQTVLTNLGENFPLPVLVTQHIDTGFDFQLASWLKNTTPFDVHVAADGEELKKGSVYLAPAGKHLSVRKEGTGLSLYKIELDDGPAVNYSKPSVDSMFFNCSRIFKNSAIAVLLTGMGRDGAKGCLSILENGGFTIAEHESSCLVYGMPKAAVEERAVKEVLPLNQIPEIIRKLTGNM